MEQRITTGARRRFVDRVARRIVSLSGFTIIGSIFAILVVIVVEVVPLFWAPAAEPLGTFPSGAAGQPIVVGIDEYRDVAFVIDASGSARFVGLHGAISPEAVPLIAEGAGGPTAAGEAGIGRFVLATADGRAIPVVIGFEVDYQGSTRTVRPEVSIEATIDIDPEASEPVRRIAYSILEDGLLLAAQIDSDRAIVLRITERNSLIGGTTRTVHRRPVQVTGGAAITALVLDDRGDDLFLGTDDGRVVRFDLRDIERARPAGEVEAAEHAGAAITALEFLLGDRTLIVGDRSGGIGSWQLVGGRGALTGRLERIHRFVPGEDGIVAIAPSHRDKSFVTLDRSGSIGLHYGTTGNTSLVVRSSLPRSTTVAIAPKGDGIVVAGERGLLDHWSLRNPHPEVSWRALFGPIWYEGYDAPEHVWQSTGGTDDFEPKLGLVPLIYGTLKGTFYALLFAVPLALAGALYTSQFMHPAIRGIVKPAIEIMAALPSVVLGFIAALWLAPAIERIVPGLFVMSLALPGAILAAMFGWRRLPDSVTSRLRPGTEVFVLMPVIALGAWVALQAGTIIESWLLQGDYRAWMHLSLGLTYDQRNSLVVGIAMGFAVIPIIYTIAEDSLSNVPKHLTAGSLALGATRWQTALKIVLPTASPGIFSAIMIGFGRAVGETMIVLMATGNTPVMDWSIFNGFRALSANIAVELPEAPAGGTLFRILFLSALLLFALTFLVNTAAEAVRLKLRARYRYL